MCGRLNLSHITLIVQRKCQQIFVNFLTYAGEENHEAKCKVEPLCPAKCQCTEDTVDCRGIGLKELPNTFPDQVVEL